MLSFVAGIIEAKDTNLLVINCNGVGFELIVSETTNFEVGEIGDTAKVHTYMAVREDAITLFGFATIEEKQTFLKLINVSGIGGKVAVAILSAMPVVDLIDAIVTENVRMLSSIKGLGKKTAERLIVELKNSFDDMQISMIKPTATPINSSAANEAIDTLVAMGMHRNEATTIVKSVAEPNDTAEVIVRKSLKNMNR